MLGCSYIPLTVFLCRLFFVALAKYIPPHVCYMGTICAPRILGFQLQLAGWRVLDMEGSCDMWSFGTSGSRWHEIEALCTAVDAQLVGLWRMRRVHGHGDAGKRLTL